MAPGTKLTSFCMRSPSNILLFFWLPQKNWGSKIRISHWRSRKMFQRTFSKIWRIYQYILRLPLRGDHFLTKTPFKNRDKQTKAPSCNATGQHWIFLNFQAYWKSIFEITSIITKEVPFWRISFPMAVFYPGALRKLGGVIFIDTWQGRVEQCF